MNVFKILDVDGVEVENLAFVVQKMAHIQDAKDLLILLILYLKIGVLANQEIVFQKYQECYQRDFQKSIIENIYYLIITY